MSYERMLKKEKVAAAFKADLCQGDKDRNKYRLCGTEHTAHAAHWTTCSSILVGHADELKDVDDFYD